MKRKILSLLLLLSFVLAQVYCQSFIIEDIVGEQGVSSQHTSFDDNQLDNFNAGHVKSLLGLNQNSDLVAAAGCGVPAGLAASPLNSTTEHVSWGIAGGALKYRLNYKEASGTVWTNLTVNGTSYNITGLTPSTTYQFRVRSVCAGGVTSAFSSIKKFKTVGADPYCTISGTTDFEYINNVTLGAINNTSGNNSGFGDYTALSTGLVQGATRKITLTPGFTGSSWPEYWEVYIDYNQDGDFADAGELVAKNYGEGTVTKKFTIPLTALTGKTRMRVVMHFNSYLGTPCGAYSDGEAEDYSVKIVAAPFAVADAENFNAASLNSLVVSPNPVKGSSANVVLQAGKPGSVNIKIADLSGRILRSETINSMIAGKNNYSLRNINLLPGTYMIMAQQGNAVIARTQFVVDK